LASGYCYFQFLKLHTTAKQCQMLRKTLLRHITSPLTIQVICSKNLLMVKIQTPHNFDWLIIYGFTSPSRFHLHEDVTITGEGLQKLGLCSALWTFEQGGIFIVSHLPWHGASVFPVSSEGPPHSVALGMWRTYSNPDPHG
jgi:hypothetical protein